MLVVVEVLEWLMCVCSLLAKQVKHQIVRFWNGCMCIFCCDDNFVDQMMFSINEVNIKVVYNFLILLVLKFHNFRSAGVGVIDFTSLLSAFACPLYRFEWLLCLTYLNIESCISDNRRVVVLFLIFLKCLRSLFLVVYNSSYCYSKWNGRLCPNLDRDAFIGLFSLVSYRIILRW